MSIPEGICAKIRAFPLPGLADGFGPCVVFMEDARMGCWTSWVFLGDALMGGCACWFLGHKSTTMTSQSMVDIWRGVFGPGESDFDCPRASEL